MTDSTSWLNVHIYVHILYMCVAVLCMCVVWWICVHATLVCVVMVLTRGDWELSWWETNHVSPGESWGRGRKGERGRGREEERETDRERWGKREMK